MNLCPLCQREFQLITCVPVSTLTFDSYLNISHHFVSGALGSGNEFFCMIVKVYDSGESSKVDEVSLSGYYIHCFFPPVSYCMNFTCLNSLSGAFVFIYEWPIMINGISMIK